MKKSDPLWIKTDKLWSQCVKSKAGGMCQFCGKRPGTSAHHVIPRSFLGTAFLVKNGLWGCSVCHNHDDPMLQQRCIEMIGESEFRRLWHIASEITRLRYADLVLIRERLEKAIKHYKEINHGN